MIDTATVGHSVMFSKTGSVSLCYNFHSYSSTEGLRYGSEKIRQHYAGCRCRNCCCGDYPDCGSFWGRQERERRTIPAEAKFEALRQAVASNNLDAAFEAAHAFKGVFGNLSLTPLYTPMVELTEHLRARETMDYAPLLNQILAKKAELAAL